MEPALLAEERAAFEKHKDEWAAKYPGKFALIHGSDLVGAFDSQAQAYAEALKRFGVTPVWIVPLTPGVAQEAHFPALTLGLLHASL